jgi:hypothetical protein
MVIGSYHSTYGEPLIRLHHRRVFQVMVHRRYKRMYCKLVLHLIRTNTVPHMLQNGSADSLQTRQPDTCHRKCILSMHQRGRSWTVTCFAKISIEKFQLYMWKFLQSCWAKICLHLWDLSMCSKHNNTQSYDERHSVMSFSVPMLHEHHRSSHSIPPTLSANN